MSAIREEELKAMGAIALGSSSQAHITADGRYWLPAASGIHSGVWYEPVPTDAKRSAAWAEVWAERNAGIVMES